MAFRIKGLDPEPFRRYFGLSDENLAEQMITRYHVDVSPGFPDRIEMRDLEVGETTLLINFEHLAVSSPYRSCHAIFVREGASTPFEAIDTIPDVMHRRILALRAFDEKGFMLDADLAQGDAIAPLIERLFSMEKAAYIHAHYAKQGCFAARIDRA